MTIAEIKESSLSNFMAEIYLEELGFLMGDNDQKEFFILNEGSNKRAKSKDVVDVSVMVFEEEDEIKERIFLHLGRRSLCHQLPELFFYPVSLSSREMTNREVVAAVKSNREKEENHIRFFAPFDMELFSLKQRLTRRFMYPYTDEEALLAMSVFSKQMIQKDIALSNSQSYLLLLHLLKSEEIKENLSLIGGVIRSVLGYDTLLKHKTRFLEESFFHGLGSGILGYTFGLNGSVLSEYDDVVATVIIPQPIDYDLLRQTITQVKEIASFFLMPTREMHVQYSFEGTSCMTLGQAFLGFDTTLA